MYHAAGRCARVRSEQIGVYDCADLHRCNAPQIYWVCRSGISMPMH
jgi:hypothetical protein